METRARTGTNHVRTVSCSTSCLASPEPPCFPLKSFPICMVGGQFASRDSHGTAMHDFYSYWSVHKETLKEERNPTVTRKTYVGARMAYLIHPGILEDALSLLSAFYNYARHQMRRCDYEAVEGPFGYRQPSWFCSFHTPACSVWSISCRKLLVWFCRC